MGNSWCVRGVLRICMAGVRRWGEGNAARHHVAWVERSEARRYGKGSCVFSIRTYHFLSHCVLERRNKYLCSFRVISKVLA